MHTQPMTRGWFWTEHALRWGGLAEVLCLCIPDLHAACTCRQLAYFQDFQSASPTRPFSTASSAAKCWPNKMSSPVRFCQMP